MPRALPKILAVVGPTGSGKSALALGVADRLQAEIVSADSRQLYQHLDIGTAKPSATDRQKVKHHFVDMLDPAVEYNAGQFGTEARRIITRIVERKLLPILVGGSGLYIKAVLDGLSDTPSKDPDFRASLESQLKNEGLQSLMDALKRVDPLTVEKMKEVTARRVLRALEVYRITGRPISQLQSEQPEKLSYEAYQIGLLWDRKELYQRIEERVEEMLSSGLEAEVKALISMGYSRSLNALNTVGYKEVFDYIDGEIDREEMVRLIKRNTRRFAKRQMTWFNRDRRIHWFRVSGSSWMDSVTQKIVGVMQT
jgi:tRNA dimethylallyltransferase